MGKWDLERTDKFNGIDFKPRADCLHLYKHNYQQTADMITNGVHPELLIYRQLVQYDLWFIVHFVLGWPGSHHPFIIQACRDVQEGPKDATLDLWGREHGKTTVITIAETIQFILTNPEKTNAILSHTRSNAIMYLRNIKNILEKSDLLKSCFPDVLYEDPAREASKWGEVEGIIVKRKGNPKEPTLGAYGLVEGMPTGHHYDRRIYDDVVTQDLVNTPELMEKVKFMFDMSHNVGTADGTHRVVGTPYHHEDALAYIKAKTSKLTGQPIYHVRAKPTLENGNPNGAPVFLPESRVEQLRTNEQIFFSQHLLDPTPRAYVKLDPNMVKLIDPRELPKRMYKFISVDPAGTATGKTKKQDSWAIVCFGVEPIMDDVGAANLYILDAVVEPLDESKAMDTLIKVYDRNGRIECLGVEKIGMSSTEIHAVNAFRAKGKYISIENGTLQILRDGGRGKTNRILQNLSWPLNNGKIHFSTGIPLGVREQLFSEMTKFPFATHDDFLDALAYAYDMLKDYRFPRAFRPEVSKRKTIDAYERADDGVSSSWLLQ